MKNKIVLWGTNAADERILVALELKVADNKVMVYTFPEAMATDDFYQQMMELWRNDQAGVTFPDGHQAIKRELSISESILPDDIKTERSDVILRAQTEWHFTVLSSKLSEAYRSELKDLEDKLAGLRNYDKDLWDNLKQFWDKVQLQLQERTLVREHADELRARTNKAFEDLKDLRKRMDDDFRESSKANMDKFTEAIQGIEQKIKDNKHLSKVFDDLKQLQKDLRDVALTRDHRNKLWQKVDDAFKIVKEKRFGEKPAEGSRGDNNPLGRTESRYNGLMDAIDKMERSIRRDQEDLDFQQKKINDTDGQLEAQIRQAKIQMIEQRFSSKKEKLDEMLKTKQQLEERMEREKAQQEKREAQQREEAARRQAANKAKEKIAEEIRRQQEELQQDPDALENAAKAINQQKGKTAAVAATAAGLAGVATDTIEPTLVADEPATVAEPVQVALATELPTAADEPTSVAEPAAEVEAPTAEAPAEAEPTPAAESPEAEEAPAKSHDSLFDAIGITLSETLEDVVDTVRAVAEVVSHQVQEKVEEIKGDIADMMKQEEE